jgi:hypothetical protein
VFCSWLTDARTGSTGDQGRIKKEIEDRHPVPAAGHEDDDEDDSKYPNRTLLDIEVQEKSWMDTEIKVRGFRERHLAVRINVSQLKTRWIAKWADRPYTRLKRGYKHMMLLDAFEGTWYLLLSSR